MSRKRLEAQRRAYSEQYREEVSTFCSKIDRDLEGYWTARRAVTSDDVAVRLEMTGHLIKKLAVYITELEENQHDPCVD